MIRHTTMDAAIGRLEKSTRRRDRNVNVYKKTLLQSFGNKPFSRSEAQAVLGFSGRDMTNVLVRIPEIRYIAAGMWQFKEGGTMDLKDKVREYCAKRRVSLLDVGAESGIGKTAIVQWMSGREKLSAEDERNLIEYLGKP